MTILTDTSGEAVAEVCNGLHPGKMPPSLQREVDKFAHVADVDLTNEQAALRDAFNKEAADGTRFNCVCRKICKQGE